ncbi:MAG: thiamine ABC transporter substrate-binding protein [Actinomycetota bacterium]|nr:thiamine ABC transporter substrate-binding protein [Actinomycetota bacterium]
MMRILGGFLIAVAALAIAACSADSAEPSEVVLMTHGSFAVSEGVLEAFTDETGITVSVIQSADAGAMVSQAILTKENPVADVLYGIDNTFLSRAIDEDLFIPHTAAAIDTVPRGLTVSGDPVTPIDFGDVCLNLDPAGLASLGLAPPDQLIDLADAAYKGSLVVEDPTTSSPGLAFLLATIATFGEDGAYPWQAYWRDLVANDVRIVPGWDQAYYGEFSGGSGEGDRPIVVSYATSPVAEVYFGDLATAPTTIVEDGCFRQVEYAGVLNGTKAEKAAGQLVDFLLERTFQEDVPLNMFVFPANSDTPLPDVFVDHAVIPTDSRVMDPVWIDENRERWLAEWANVVR